MGARKVFAVVCTVLAFTFGVVIGYLKGFEEGYNLTAGTPYPTDVQDNYEEE